MVYLVTATSESAKAVIDLVQIFKAKKSISKIQKWRLYTGFFQLFLINFKLNCMVRCSSTFENCLGMPVCEGKY